MRNNRYRVFLFASLAFIFSCNNGKNANEGKPIVLGDSSSIVTENDPKYLQDFVPDIKPSQQPQEVKQDTTPASPVNPIPQPAATTPVKTEEPAAAPANNQQTENGLDINFKDLALFIPKIDAEAYHQRRADPNGLSYKLNDGSLNGKQIKVKQGTVTRIIERVQTSITLKNELGTLPLNSLGGTSDWAPLNGKGDTYTISGLDVSRANMNISPAALRNAITRAMRGKRMSRLAEQRWLNSVRRVRTLNQKPLIASLRSVTWKIEGKDTRGRGYQKQVRIDL